MLREGPAHQSEAFGPGPFCRDQRLLRFTSDEETHAEEEESPIVLRRNLHRSRERLARQRELAVRLVDEAEVSHAVCRQRIECNSLFQVSDPSGPIS